MLRWIISKKIDSVEKDLGVPMEYLRHIVKHSLGAFMKFAKVIPLAEYRKTLPAAPYFAGRLVATRREDCGPCVQIEVNQARKAGVDAGQLKAILEDRWDDLPEEMADACRFADAVVNATGEEGGFREKIRRRHGEKGLIEMSLAIAVCRIFPTTKRGLGYAVSCSKVEVNIYSSTSMKDAEKL